MNPAEQAVVEHALQRGYLTPAQLEAARAQQARSATPLLALLRELFLTPPQVAELTQVYSRASRKATSAGWATPGVEELTVVTQSPPGTAHLGSAGSVLLRSGESTRRPGEPGFSGRIGPYQVERELARGGMGVVYVARHEQLGRRVALKLILAEVGGEGALLERFKVEAQAVARLQHPNIVAVHDVGRAQDGHPYIAMDLVEGEGLDQRLKREGALDPHEAAGLVEKMAQAMQHAHDQSILHRDLKPANVLIDSEGRPRITDFGLARDLSETKERLTRTGELLGTPAYMPPEQAEGRSAEIDERADVYSLGATLYALLTGEPPFKGQSAMNVVAKVLTSDVRLPRALRPELDADLETIVLKCMEKVPADRYGSAGELASDLSRYAYKKPIKARRKSLALRLKRWGQRKPALLVALLVSALIAFIAGPVIAIKGSAIAPRLFGGEQASQRLDAIAPILSDGVSLREQGQIGRAMRRFKEASEAAPADPRPYEQIGLTYAGRGSREEAIEAFSRGVELCAELPWTRGRLLLERARVSFGAGAISPALSDLDASLACLGQPRAANDPTSAQRQRKAAFELRASIHESVGELALAADDAAQAIEAGETAAGWVRLAKLLLRVGGKSALERGRDAAARGRTLDPDYVPATLIYAHTLCLLGDYEAGMRTCEGLPERMDLSSSERADAFITRALIRLRGLVDSTAMEDLRKALELDPKRADARAYLVYTRFQVLANLADTPEDHHELEEAIKQDPRCAVAYAIQGEVLLRGEKKDRSAARACVEKALELDPGCASAYRVRARYEERTGGDWAAGLEDCNRALDLDPGDLFALELRARMRQRLQDDAGTIEDTTAVLARWPFLLPAHTMRASAYESAGRLEEALAGWNDVIRIMNDTPNGVNSTRFGAQHYERRATLRLRMKQGKDALPDIDEAMKQYQELGRPRPGLYVLRGEAHLQAGELEQARADLETFMALRGPKARSRVNQARELLAEISRRQGRAVPAPPVSPAASGDVTLGPGDSPLSYLKRGRARFQAGRFEEARGDVERFLDTTRIKREGAPLLTEARAMLAEIRSRLATKDD